MVRQYYKDEYALIELDDEIPCVKLTLTGLPRFSEHYQLVQLKRLELMHLELKNFDNLQMLTDSRLAGPVLDVDVTFFKQSVLPQIEEAGIRHLAVVQPPGKFTRLNIQEMVSDAERIVVGTFDDIREARAWLRSKKEVLT